MKSAYIGRDDDARRSDIVMAYRGGDVLLCGGFCEAPRQGAVERTPECRSLTSYCRSKGRVKIFNFQVPSRVLLKI